MFFLILLVKLLEDFHLKWYKQLKIRIHHQNISLENKANLNLLENIYVYLEF